jgi:hypothetical protein
MRVPSLSRSPVVFIRLGVAHFAVLDADPETRSLAPAIQRAIERVRSMWQRRLVASEHVVVQQALRNRADFELDRAVKHVAGVALTASGDDRGKMPYAELFKDGLTAVTGAALDEEIARVTTLEEKLAGSGALGAHVPALQAARSRLSTTIAAHVEAIRVRGGTGADLDLAKVDWVRQYRASWGALLSMHGDAAWANSFFADLDAAGGNDDEGEEAGEGGAGGA